MPLSQEAEREIILTLTATLNEAFELNLCEAPCTARTRSDLASSRRDSSWRKVFAVVGGSQASRMRDILYGREIPVCDMTTPGWKPNRKNVEEQVNFLTSLNPSPDVLVIQAMDNLSYYCLQEDGTLTLQVCQEDGYHVTGELRVATKEQNTNTLRILKPLMTALPTAKVILVTCLPRYVLEELGCCKEEGHMVGHSAKSYSDICRDLATLNKTAKSYVLQEHLKNVWVYDPMTSCDLSKVEAYSDSVHMMPAVYKRIADDVFDLATGAEDAKRKAGPEGTEHTKRVRLVSGPPSRGGGPGAYRGRGRGGRPGGYTYGRRGSW